MEDRKAGKKGKRVTGFAVTLFSCPEHGSNAFLSRKNIETTRGNLAAMPGNLASPARQRTTNLRRQEAPPETTSTTYKPAQGNR